MSGEIKPNPPEPIGRNHQVQIFDCGESSLNKYLKSYALQNHFAGGARTYVSARQGTVVGYYSLAYGSVAFNIVPSRIKEGLGRYPISVMVLARLAIDKTEQGKGLGEGLLLDALTRTLQASEIAGLRAMLVHAKNEKAKQFYQKYGFIASPIDDKQLYLLIKDIKKTVIKMA